VGDLFPVPAGGVVFEIVGFQFNLVVLALLRSFPEFNVAVYCGIAYDFEFDIALFG